MNNVPAINTIPTSTTTQPKTDPTKTMKAVVWKSSSTVLVKECPKPCVTEPKDALIKITSTTICGSDLHLYHGKMPGTQSGDILGHECMGIVEDVGSEVQSIKKGDKVVVSALIADGTCEFCKKELYSLCDTTNSSETMNTLYGHKIAGAFGYSHITGGYPGGQAEYIRVPFADVNCLVVPHDVSDEKVLLLSDVLSTSWHANELGDVGEGISVVIWGAGPIGLASAAWAKYRSASRIIVIDNIDYRLKVAANLGCEIINFDLEDPKTTIKKLMPHGPDVCIDAVGFRYSKTWLHTIETALKLETDAIDSLTEAIYVAKKGGTVVLIGDYIGVCNHFPIGAVMEKGVKIVGSQVHVQKYWKKLLGILLEDKFDPSFLITATKPLDFAAEAYNAFDLKKEDSIKIILKPELTPIVSK